VRQHQRLLLTLPAIDDGESVDPRTKGALAEVDLEGAVSDHEAVTTEIVDEQPARFEGDRAPADVGVQTEVGSQDEED
jgi:hypothetical protein